MRQDKAGLYSWHREKKTAEIPLADNTPSCADLKAVLDKTERATVEEFAVADLCVHLPASTKDVRGTDKPNLSDVLMTWATCPHCGGVNDTYTVEIIKRDSSVMLKRICNCRGEK